MPAGSPSRRIAFLLPPRVHLLDITGPIHIFQEAVADGAPYALHFIALTSANEVRSSAGLAFARIAAYEHLDLEPGDLLFIPGMDFPTLTDPGFLGRCAPFFSWLRQQAAQEVQICSVCTGAFLVGYAELLRKRQTTTHWKYFDQFQEAFPQTTLLKERLFVRDGNLYASAGVSSGIDLALHLLEEHWGAPFAARIAKEVVLYLRRGENDPQLSVFLRYRNHLNDRVHQVQDILAARLHESLTIAEVAREVHTSPRHLTRIFRKTTGLSIGDYQRQLRRERAQQLLHTGQKRAAVAQAVGLNSLNQLRTLLDEA